MTGSPVPCRSATAVVSSCIGASSSAAVRLNSRSRRRWLASSSADRVARSCRRARATRRSSALRPASHAAAAVVPTTARTATASCHTPGWVATRRSRPPVTTATTPTAASSPNSIAVSDRRSPSTRNTAGATAAAHHSRPVPRPTASLLPVTSSRAAMPTLTTEPTHSSRAPLSTIRTVPTRVRPSTANVPPSTTRCARGTHDSAGWKVNCTTGTVTRATPQITVDDPTHEPQLVVIAQDHWTPPRSGPVPVPYRPDVPWHEALVAHDASGPPHEGVARSAGSGCVRASGPCR